MTADRAEKTTADEGLMQYRTAPDSDWTIAAVAEIVEPLGMTLPPPSEIILHDLSKLPNSIVAIYGDVTGRQVGDPATNYLLERASSGLLENDVGYETTLDDGRVLRSSTVIIRNRVGNPVAALCINIDISAWLQVEKLAAAMTFKRGGPDHAAVSQPPASTASGTAGTEEKRGSRTRERFPKSVDELTDTMIQDAIQSSGLDVLAMKKRHKVQIVKLLQDKGLFLIKDAVEKVSGALGVSRFTIYNYLNEIAESPGEYS
jgi:predicted transcriptional regulator YheO